MRQRGLFSSAALLIFLVFSGIPSAGETGPLLSGPHFHSDDFRELQKLLDGFQREKRARAASLVLSYEPKTLTAFLREPSAMENALYRQSLAGGSRAPREMWWGLDGKGNVIYRNEARAGISIMPAQLRENMARGIIEIFGHTHPSRAAALSGNDFQGFASLIRANPRLCYVVVGEGPGDAIHSLEARFLTAAVRRLNPFLLTYDSALETSRAVEIIPQGKNLEIRVMLQERRFLRQDAFHTAKYLIHENGTFRVRHGVLNNPGLHARLLRAAMRMISQSLQKTIR